MSKQGRRYTARFKFQVILELLKGSKTIGQIARAYGVHPITISHWKKEFIEKGPELFSQKTTIHEYERKIQDLERLIGHRLNGSNDATDSGNDGNTDKILPGVLAIGVVVVHGNQQRTQQDHAAKHRGWHTPLVQRNLENLEYDNTHAAVNQDQ